MMNDLAEYFRQLTNRCGSAWNRFWFTPRDPFMLSLLRIIVGLMALYFVGSHTADLIRWFGPDGILNPETTIQLTGGDQLPYSFRFSYLYLANTPTALWALHAVGLVVVAAMIVGLWSRITTVATLLVVLSYIHRGPMLTAQFEPVLTMVLAYLCLAPTGRYLSLDAWLGRHKPPTRRQLLKGPEQDDLSTSANIATRLIQLHLAALCLMIGLNMLAGEVWWSGEAMWWLIARTESRLVDLTRLAHAFLLVNVWTHGVVTYQLAFGTLVWNRLARPILLALGVVVWASLALVTGLVAWCVMMVVASLAFVDPEWLKTRCGYGVVSSESA